MYITINISIQIIKKKILHAAAAIFNNLFQWAKDVFAVYPRIDLIHQNMVWQQTYSKVNYAHAKECSPTFSFSLSSNLNC